MEPKKANIQISTSFVIWFVIIFIPACIIIILCTVIIICCMRKRKAKKKALNEREKLSIQKAAQFNANNKKQPGAGNESKIQMHDIDNEWQNEGNNNELEGFNEL